MSFGKKKTSLPQRRKRPTQTTITSHISHRQTKEMFNENHHQGGAPDMNASQTLTMNDILNYGHGVCEGRGYPAEFCLSIGIGLVWLAERGLPSLSFLTKTIFKNVNVDWQKQGMRAGQDGFGFMPCPIIGSSFLGGMIDELVAAGSGKAINMTVDGPTLLLLPRISDHAKRHNLSLHMAISPMKGSKDNPTILTVKDGELAVQTGDGSLYDPSRITIRIVPSMHLPPTHAFTSPAERRDTQIIQSALLDLIDLSRASAGLPPVGETAEKKSVAARVGMSRLPEDTKNFFRTIIAKDFELQRLFALLSKGNVSGIAHIISNTDDTTGVENSVLMTMSDSEADKFYRHCMQKGWMDVSHNNSMKEYGGTAYHITKTGQMAFSVMLERLSFTATS